MLPVSLWPEEGRGLTYRKFMGFYMRGFGVCFGYSNHEVIEFNISIDGKSSTTKTSALDMRREDFGLLKGLDVDDQLTNRDKAEVFNVFFASIFNVNDGPKEFQCPELEDHGWKND
ncbi:hypothetical protein DUI87_09156 [Hirundo rustica rustica]|uniref:Uncharacterized protein n=1 Tax=Hirundo rustica rustica TaxID=333673 RepID=A0A3M0KLE6_HIRRU|nr:hypothetical protein DUI87_09156 [Hirundo rustica rustica]